MKIRSFLVVVSIVFFVFFGCRERDENLENVITEVEKKETELKEVGVPKFILEEQKYLETNTNVVEQKNIDEFFDSKTNIEYRITKKETKKTDMIVEKKVEPTEMVFEKTPIKKSYDKPEKVSKPQTRKVSSVKPSFSDLKIYFSYSNGKKYIDRKNPGKITSVVYAGRGIWYVDFEVYAIPYSSVGKYEKMLKDSYLIGIGRNISVIDGRSQLTVYWTGLNLKKKYLPNGKYAIVVKTKFKNMKKMIVSTYTKTLGVGNPIVVILAN